MAKVNKVNPAATDATAKEEKKTGRIEFSIKDAKCLNENADLVSATNEDGLLTIVPKSVKDAEGKKVLYAGFNVRKHLPLKKADFAGLATYMRYQAFVARSKAVVLIKSAEDKEAKASHIEQFGDEITRKKVQKVARMREQLATLQTQLEADGVDISSI